MNINCWSSTFLFSYDSSDHMIIWLNDSIMIDANSQSTHASAVTGTNGTWAVRHVQLEVEPVASSTGTGSSVYAPMGDTRQRIYRQKTSLTSQDWTGLHRTALNSLNSELLILPKLLSLHFIGMQISDDEFLFDIDLILNHDWWWFIKDGSENRIVNVESPSLTFKTKWSLKHVSMMLRLDRKKEIEFPVGNGEHRAGAADTDAAGFIWDLTNSVTFSCWKADCHKEHLPCLLRGHRLWHTAKQRNLAWNCLFFICFDYAFVVRLYDSSIIRIMNHESLSWFPRHWYSRVAES